MDWPWYYVTFKVFAQRIYAGADACRCHGIGGPKFLRSCGIGRLRQNFPVFSRKTLKFAAATCITLASANMA